MLRQVVEAFRKGELPGRLPYKLRELAPSLQGILSSPGNTAAPDAAQVTRLLTGLLRRELDGTLESQVGQQRAEGLRKAVLTLWRAGMPRHDGATPADYARIADGLLLARALASGDAEDEET